MYSCHSESDGMTEDSTSTDITDESDTGAEQYLNDKVSFSQSELDQIADLVNSIPVIIKDDYNELYTEWQSARSIHSNRNIYFLLDEYYDLLEYCKIYGRAIWPLVLVDISKYLYNYNLLIALTNAESITSLPAVSFSFVEGVNPTPYIHYTSVVFCKKLLVEEYDNMLKSIQEISEKELDYYSPTPVSMSTFTVDDIKSYNITTGEIVFTTDSIVEIALKAIRRSRHTLSLYHDDELLFEVIRLEYPFNKISWKGCFVLKCFHTDDKTVLDYIDTLIKGKKYLQNRDTTHKYDKEWDIFINYLIDANKIIE